MAEEVNILYTELRRLAHRRFMEMRIDEAKDVLHRIVIKLISDDLSDDNRNYLLEQYDKTEDALRLFESCLEKINKDNEH